MPPPVTGTTVKFSIDVDDLQIYRIIIKNTGNLPVRDFPIRLAFEQATNDFMVLSTKHETAPPHEFGEIKDDFTERARPRFVYSLLNPGDEDAITLLANEKSALKVYGKGEGVTFNTSNAPESIALSKYAVFIMAALSALLALLVRPLIARRIGRGPA